MDCDTAAGKLEFEFYNHISSASSPEVKLSSASEVKLSPETEVKVELQPAASIPSTCSRRKLHISLPAVRLNWNPFLVAEMATLEYSTRSQARAAQDLTVSRPQPDSQASLSGSQCARCGLDVSLLQTSGFCEDGCLCSRCNEDIGRVAGNAQVSGLAIMFSCYSFSVSLNQPTLSQRFGSYFPCCFFVFYIFFYYFIYIFY